MSITSDCNSVFLCIVGPPNVACPPRPDPPKCDLKSNVRRLDGTCNNLQHPLWGSYLQPFERFLPPEYSDGMPKSLKEGF